MSTGPRCWRCFTIPIKVQGKLRIGDFTIYRRCSVVWRWRIQPEYATIKEGAAVNLPNLPVWERPSSSVWAVPLQTCLLLDNSYYYCCRAPWLSVFRGRHDAPNFRREPASGRRSSHPLPRAALPCPAEELIGGGGASSAERNTRIVFRKARTPKGGSLVRDFSHFRFVVFWWRPYPSSRCIEAIYLR